MTYDIEFKITGLDEPTYNSIIELLKTIKQAEIVKSQNDGKPLVSSSVPYKEDWNPDWKGDPDDPNRWNGW